MVEEYSEAILPVCHVYYPDTFQEVLKSFFLEGEEEVSDSTRVTSTSRKGFLLGRWELRPGRPGKFDEKKESQRPTLRSLRRRRRKKSGGENSKNSATDGRGEATSSSVSTSTATASQEQQGNGVVNKSFETNFRRVLAVNIIGVFGGNGEKPKGPFYDDLQVVGEVQIGEEEAPSSSSSSRENSQPYLYFKFTPPRLSSSSSSSGVEHGELSVTSLVWNGNLHQISQRDRLLVFIYDPVEFQQWKVPKEYPLGVAPVFIDGLNFIQHYLQLDHEFPFTPAFPPVLQDHQDLNACSEGPTSFYTHPVLDFISRRSSGLQQISHKVSLLTGTFLGYYQILPVINFLIILLLDGLIGYIISSYLIEIPNMLGILHTTVDDMLARLNHLLRWLRGAPAGLKLNINLNSLFWRFFSYHIHLWANYIGILEPIFAIILHTIQYFGVLGSTIQISLLKDLLSLATFHVYCLYIYATRLYNIQTATIKALCRSFFGRKYNPLRDRIDNVQLTTSELFLSSFCFVILIFLLPTTMVYYAGFVCLRVPVLLVERTLLYFVSAFNKLPIVSWILVFVRSPRVADEVYLSPVVPSASPTAVISHARSNCVTFRLSLRSTRTLFTPPDLGKGIKNIVGAIMEGIVLKG